MKTFFNLIDPLIITAIIIMVIIFIYSLLGEMNKHRLIKKAIEKNNVDLLKNIDLGSTASHVFKQVLSDTPALLAFGLLLINAYLILGGKPVPEYFSHAFFLSMGFYFGKKFSKENIDKTIENK